MPPLQRTVGELGLVVDPGGFRGSLGTWRNAALTGTLGHLVGPEAPSGLVHGVAEPSQAPPAVSREVDEGLPAPRRRHFSAPPAAPEGRPVQRVVAAEPPPRFGPLTSASASPSETWGRRRLSPVRADVLATPEPPSPATPVLPDTSVAGESRPVQRVVAAEPPEPARPPGGFGLGRPLAGLPPTAQRRPAADTGGPSSSPVPEPHTAPEPPTESGPEPVPESGPEQPVPASRPLLGDDPLPLPEAAAPPEPSVHRPPVPLQRAPATPGEPARVPVPAGPLAPLVAQRSLPLFSAPAPPPEAGRPAPPAGPAPELRVVPVRWAAPGDSPAAPATPVQRTAVPPTTAARTGPAPPPSMPAPTPTPMSVQRATPTAAAPLDAGAVAVAAGVARRMPDGSVVFHAPAVQRQEQADPPTAPEPPPEPPPEPLPAPPPEPPGAESTAGVGDPAAAAASVPPAATPEAGAAGQDGAPSGGPSGAPPVSDELVRALFAPLSRLLRAELRLERERAGFLIDTRH
ncbi:hypothetical protein [Streptomyces millisiae]|uniref:Uncharacterized protein n=1 Tax=Streptomyces millisiae TaxID=3075542 RepID=A0ABU2LP60_9ACTN|nr:hypothetical protein [Streptomyces sp. DSM 44918]MDT0319366.1 hypothetical protein [Streptomyces sp. DSM 44918]